MSKVRADQFPLYQTVKIINNQAGFKKSSLGEAAQMCLQPPERNINTPEEIYKYRKSYKQQHGVTIVLNFIIKQHYGVVGDPLPSK